MKEIINDCVGCPPGMGCVKSACPYQNQVVFTCDSCGEDVDCLWDVDGQEICEDCLHDFFEHETVDEWLDHQREDYENYLDDYDDDPLPDIDDDDPWDYND